MAPPRTQNLLKLRVGVIPRPIVHRGINFLRNMRMGSFLNEHGLDLESQHSSIKPQMLE